MAVDRISELYNRYVDRVTGAHRGKWWDLISTRESHEDRRSALVDCWNNIFDLRRLLAYLDDVEAEIPDRILVLDFAGTRFDEEYQDLPTQKGS
jgi:hypothetical protein